MVCLVYINDIVVAGPAIAETVRWLGLVWQRLREAGLKLKPSKCELFRLSVTFLGHTVDAEGIDTDPSKIYRFNREGTRSFLGLAGYYREHDIVAGYVVITAQLTEMTKKNACCEWGEPQEMIYQRLIEELSGEMILVHLPVDWGHRCLRKRPKRSLESSVLNQVQDGLERVIRYASKKM